MELILDEIAEIVSDGESAEDEMMRQELSKEIDGFLAALSEEKRGMFIRRYWYSDGVIDIAKRYGKSESTVSVTLNRIRKKLRDYLKERGYDL